MIPSASRVRFPHSLFYNGYLALETQYDEEQCSAHLKRRFSQLLEATKTLGVKALKSFYGNYVLIHIIRWLLRRDAYRPRIQPLLALDKEEHATTVTAAANLSPEAVVKQTRAALASTVFSSSASTRRSTPCVNGQS